MKRAREDDSNGTHGDSSVTVGPSNSLVSPLLTDKYQITMAYALWQHGRAEKEAVFELFFRKAPFDGEYCIYAGQDEVIKFVSNYKVSESDVDYLRKTMPQCDPQFFEWFRQLDCSRVRIFAIEDGSVVFPREPLLRVEGPLAMVQLLETTLLNLINFPSLIATNAARMRVAAEGKRLLEFGLRRAQGPDGGLSASKYAYLGGFDGTSNVLAGKLFDISTAGTHAHSFVMSYTGLDDLTRDTIQVAGCAQVVDFKSLVLQKRQLLQEVFVCENHDGELAAFIAYAQSFSEGFLSLVDTYDTLKSGVPNFMAVAWALLEVGYKPLGVRLDSGDLAYLSRMTRDMFRKFDQLFCNGKPTFAHLNIVASNDIKEDVLLALAREGHEIDTFGIGTHLVTCQSQPALGCVFKLVEIDGKPRMKLSQDIVKVVIPKKKQIYRLYGQDGAPLLDIMQSDATPPPQVGEKIRARHPFRAVLRAHVVPAQVKPLLACVFDGADPQVAARSLSRTLHESRAHCIRELASLRSDHRRPLNPTPYKISLSEELYDVLHALWDREAPIAELK